MTDIERSEVVGPYSDLQTRNLVLQIKSTDPIDEDQGYQWEEVQHPGRVENDLVEREGRSVEKKGAAVPYTAEYFTAIADEKERMRAYRGLVVVSIFPDGEDTEIETDPFKFLYAPRDASFAQVRDAYIRLSKAWFPDLMYPENKEQFNRIFGFDEFPIKENDPQKWFNEMQSILPPDTLTTEDFESLRSDEQETYQKAHEAHEKKKSEYEDVKAEMRRRATEKMTIINKAFEAAKKRFSKEEIESFAGFNWKKEALYGPARGVFEQVVLPLEGNGQLIKKINEAYQDDQIYLEFDYGHALLERSQKDYRQRLPLRAFFAWTELRRGVGLCPTLLDDLVKTYSFEDDRAEQLRIMIINHEAPEFIVTALNITDEDSGELLGFLDEVYEGPMYYHMLAIHSDEFYPLGVEFTSDGRLILKYKAQSIQGGGSSKGTWQETQFSQTDVQIMQAVAYGPLLQEPH